jgi:hypothetical protein
VDIDEVDISVADIDEVDISEVDISVAGIDDARCVRFVVDEDKARHSFRMVGIKHNV